MPAKRIGRTNSIRRCHVASDLDTLEAVRILKQEVGKLTTEIRALSFRLSTMEAHAQECRETKSSNGVNGSNGHGPPIGYTPNPDRFKVE